MGQVSVNIEQSKAIGKIIGQFKFRPDFLERDFLSIDIEDELKASMYFYAVGICHQTYHLAAPKLNLFGWDFLEYGFLKIAQEKPELLDARFLVETSIPKLKQLIQAFFAEDHKPENCTLDRLDERIKLWKDMAAFILQHADSVLDFIKQSNNEAEYFYNQLKNTEAYSDPFQKKTSFLLKILEDADFTNFGVSNDLIPIMDYHMQRVLMRSGCIEIADNTVYKQLVDRVYITDDSKIRSSCIQSMKIIAHESGLSVLKMNDVFYTMGRSCCNENPICISDSCEKKPCSLSLAIDIPQKHDCIFIDICKGASNEKYRKLWQPIVETHYY